jgi:hypothetical protein
MTICFLPPLFVYIFHILMLQNKTSSILLTKEKRLIRLPRSRVANCQLSFQEGGQAWSQLSLLPSLQLNATLQSGSTCMCARIGRTIGKTLCFSVTLLGKLLLVHTAFLSALFVKPLIFRDCYSYLCSFMSLGKL